MHHPKKLALLFCVIALLAIIGFFIITTNTGDLKKKLIHTTWTIHTAEGEVGTVLFNKDTASFSIKCSDGRKEKIKGYFKVNNYTRKIKIKNSKKELTISVENTKFNEFDKGSNTVNLEGFCDYSYPNTVDGVMEKSIKLSD
ncbi:MULTISPECIES: hypothetical protein [Carnobacterium]|uniref:Uncharacterized protein n=1 Tax=Carnobacterium divergens TaxID=2748 RepID=A0A2R8A3J2_CARDV|nr:MULTISPECIES: hypothetical protein [Carnobacterium]MCO6019245.1 hypothetical protein [Carnobacterium divergens]MDT1940228.1 hypothetical protein [Carnobacterium divergens]MDT1942666.1 hypothetical protein [Carnobacterium divergens]MDT1948472.1 hypothetical protein [Carnobacterium divergens]MDT1950953.1 hypothetical protein [Carnobacterium divergens]